MESILSTHPNLPNFEPLVSKGIPSKPFSGSSIQNFDHSNPYKASALNTCSKDFLALNVSSSPASNGKVELRQESNNMRFTNVHSTTLVASMNQESLPPPSTFLKIEQVQEQEHEPKQIHSLKDVLCVSNVEHGRHQKHGRNNNNKKLQAKVIIDPKGLQGKITKGQWSPEEDRSLIQLVKRHGAKKWTKIARMLSGRVGKQCRDRWENHLRPEIKKGAWSEEEEKLLIKLHMQIGGKWSEIARRMPSRSENTIKNHWYATKRKHNSSSKTKHSNNLLHNYIRSLGSTSSHEYDHNDFEDISVSNDSSSQELENIPLAQQDNANFELDHEDDIPYIPLSLVVDRNSEVENQQDPSYLSTSSEFDERKEMDFFGMLFEDFH